MPDYDDIDALLAELRPLVFRWAFVRTGSMDDAEDVAQTVMIRVHARIGTFEGRSSLTTWVYRVTANTAGELIRRRGIWRRVRERLAGMRPERSAVSDPTVAIEAERVRERVQHVLRALPPRQRAAFDLVDLQGYTPTEAAEMMDMRAGTLRVHLLRARRAIRARILADAGFMAAEER